MSTSPDALPRTDNGSILIPLGATHIARVLAAPLPGEAPEAVERISLFHEELAAEAARLGVWPADPYLHIAGLPKLGYALGVPGLEPVAAWHREIRDKRLLPMGDSGVPAATTPAFDRAAKVAATLGAGAAVAAGAHGLLRRVLNRRQALAGLGTVGAALCGAGALALAPEGAGAVSCPCYQWFWTCVVYNGTYDCVTKWWEVHYAWVNPGVCGGECWVDNVYYACDGRCSCPSWNNSCYYY